VVIGVGSLRAWNPTSRPALPTSNSAKGITVAYALDPVLDAVADLASLSTRESS
jgi:hypothetical protein